LLPETDALELLRHGTLEIEGRLVYAANPTLRAVITYEGVEARCVYKPVRGERPLWDFPDGTLAGREVSAYLVGAATGWSPVPPTVLRDGPLGIGACQLWIETVNDGPDDDADDDADPDDDLASGDAAGDSAAAFGDGDAGDGDAGDDLGSDVAPIFGFVPSGRVPFGWRRVANAEDDDGRPYVLAHANDERLARLAAFDVVINNADRKGGHILQTSAGNVFGVDHGVSFHLENKLRTILWGWIGEPLPAETIEVLTKLRADLNGELGEALYEHLMVREVAKIGVRVDRLLRNGCYPRPPSDWPAVPWPPI
jgi:uncharacterized repeat protein (TIGR03843 family)